MKTKRLAAVTKLSIAVLALLQSAHCDLETSCNALAEVHLYQYQTCMVLHQVSKTWSDAAASCNAIPPSADSGKGHLLHLVEGRPVKDLLVGNAVSTLTAHTGIYNTDTSGANDRGWYYMRDGDAIAEQLPAFYPWHTGEPNDNAAAGRDVWARYVSGALYKMDGPAATIKWYLCQYSKIRQVEMERQATKDGYKPRADTGCLLKTKTGVPHHLHCIMSCLREWGASLCRGVAHDAATRTCLHAAAHPTLRGGDQWQVDGEGAQWTVWALVK